MIRKLTLKEDLRSNQVSEKLLKIEDKIKTKLPDLFKDLLMMVEGSTIEESIFFDSINFFPINQFLEISIIIQRADQIEKIYNEQHLPQTENENLFFIPFAIDSGGWSYHISIAKDSYNKIWLNRFDNNKENPFIVIAPSLEEFIDGLISEETAIQMGY